MARTIFYSWQSDLKPSQHRYFIEKCLKNALNELEHDANNNIWSLIETHLE